MSAIAMGTNPDAYEDSTLASDTITSDMLMLSSRELAEEYAHKRTIPTEMQLKLAPIISNTSDTQVYSIAKMWRTVVGLINPNPAVATTEFSTQPMIEAEKLMNLDIKLTLKDELSNFDDDYAPSEPEVYSPNFTIPDNCACLKPKVMDSLRRNGIKLICVRKDTRPASRLEAILRLNDKLEQKEIESPLYKATRKQANELAEGWNYSKVYKPKMTDRSVNYRMANNRNNASRKLPAKVAALQIPQHMKAPLKRSGRYPNAHSGGRRLLELRHSIRVGEIIRKQVIGQ